MVIMYRDFVRPTIKLEPFPSVPVRESMMLHSQKTRNIFKRILTMRNQTRHWKTTIKICGGPKTYQR